MPLTDNTEAALQTELAALRRRVAELEALRRPAPNPVRKQASPRKLFSRPSYWTR